jgi:hypothetical protein
MVASSEYFFNYDVLTAMDFNEVEAVLETW